MKKIVVVAPVVLVVVLLVSPRLMEPAAPELLDKVMLVDKALVGQIPFLNVEAAVVELVLLVLMVVLVELLVTAVTELSLRLFQQLKQQQTLLVK